MSKLYGISVRLDMIDDCVDILYGDPKLARVKAKAEHIPDHADGWCFEDDTLNTWVYIGKTPRNYGLIAHETLHAVRHIFQKRCIPFREENDEIMAYALGHVVERIASTKPDRWYVFDERSNEFKPCKKRKKS